MNLGKKYNFNQEYVEWRYMFSEMSYVARFWMSILPKNPHYDILWNRCSYLWTKPVDFIEDMQQKSLFAAFITLFILILFRFCGSLIPKTYATYSEGVVERSIRVFECFCLLKELSNINFFISFSLKPFLD